MCKKIISNIINIFMYIFIIFILIFVTINFILISMNKNIEGFISLGSIGNAFKKAGNSIKDTAKRAGNTIKDTAKKAGNTIKDTAKKAGRGIKDTAKRAGKGIKDVAYKVGGELEKAIPIPKASYVPKTYPKASYGIGVGQIPLTIIMRPLKPGVKISKVKL